MSFPVALLSVLTTTTFVASAAPNTIIDIAYMLEGKGEETVVSRSRHPSWHVESESILNEHVALEQAAAVQYRALYAYFRRDSVNLKNTAKFFEESANEEWGHASELMSYQITRGGKVDIKPLDAPVHEFPATDSKSDARVAFESALAMEKKVLDSLLRLHATCGKRVDPSCQDTIDHYVQDQVTAIDHIARHVADLDRVGNDGHAVWEWDNEFEA
mmetsp:Transcript_14606/g.47585  ORF Transcript_14606/g.47585 Transcript_14606/m.47585 type:complete len:216 (-) Transcript_14606:499-1146(-)